MYIGLENIRELFFDSPSLLKESNHTSCLTDWIRMKDAPVPYVTSILYVCEYDEDLRNLDFIPNMHILCIAKKHDDLEKLTEEVPSSVNILFLKHENQNVVSRNLLRYFDAQCGIGLFADTLLEILSSEGGVQTMVDRAYGALGNPIFVFDAGFNLVAANWEEAKKTNTGMELIKNRGFSDREFKMVNERGMHKNVQKSEVPIMAYNHELGYDQLLCAIDTQKDIGHIVVSAVNRPLNSVDGQLLHILKKCIDQQLKKDEFVRNVKGFNYEYILKDLLDGKISTGKPFLDRLNSVSSKFLGNMYCLVIETARSSCILNTYHIRSLFDSRFPNTKTLMYKGNIIVILSMSVSRFPPEGGILEDAAEICENNDLYAGLSNCFQNIAQIAEYYKQALRAVELGVCAVNKPSLFIYEDYYLEHIKSIFIQKESPETFCHPKMKFLSDYDKKRNSELAYTLYMYLVHERNIATTAAAMHMHRNSLVYRIKRINTLIGDNFESSRERLYLILSYEINHKP